MDARVELEGALLSDEGPNDDREDAKLVRDELTLELDEVELKLGRAEDEEVRLDELLEGPAQVLCEVTVISAAAAAAIRRSLDIVDEIWK